MEELGLDAMDRTRLRDLALIAHRDRWRLRRFIMRRVADPDESDEIAQQAFLVAVRGIARYRAEASLRTWLFGIAAVLSARHCVRRPVGWFLGANDNAGAELLPHPGADPAFQVMSQELLRRVAHHLEQLPHEMRRAVQLVLVEEIPYVDAAKQLRVPEGTVRSRISRARSLLRKRMREEGVDMAVD